MLIEQVKRNLGKPVRFTNPRLYIEDSRYILTGCIIRCGEYGFFYQAELQDINHKNSLIICRLDEITEEK